MCMFFVSFLVHNCFAEQNLIIIKKTTIRMQTDSNSRKGIGRRSTSLRQTRSPQNSLELQVPSLHSPVISSMSCGNAATTQKKSNWEVIEHFNSAEKGRGSVSSSLIAVSCCCSLCILFDGCRFCWCCCCYCWSFNTNGHMFVSG